MDVDVDRAHFVLFNNGLIYVGRVYWMWRRFGLFA